MKLKVVESKMSSSFLVVQDCYGEERIALNGVEYSYEPIPLCRVPDGYGRTREEAKALAHKIAQLLMQDAQEEEEEIVELTAEPPLPNEEHIPF